MKRVYNEQEKIEFEKTLLNFLLSDYSINVNDFVNMLEEIDDIEKDLNGYNDNPQVYDEEEIKLAKVDLEDLNKKISKIESDFFKINKDVNWEEEVKKVREYVKNQNELINNEISKGM